ncbi:hypothetical protein, partial [Roseovarius sp.]|uniref:hypothetical protein n=1 Tax=Roseovarius sp. TaxID=1486281 RepID=UPI003A981A55
ANLPSATRRSYLQIPSRVTTRSIRPSPSRVPVSRLSSAGEGVFTAELGESQGLFYRKMNFSLIGLFFSQIALFSYVLSINP